MSAHVFLGPSLRVEEARQVLPDAEYLPPVAMGDVYALVERRAPRAIAIIDGLFERTPAVWHKEILYALSRGVRVYGAASMGALRAAELASFGMIGVGHIFEAFRDGELEDDDEVTVVHGPAEYGFRTLSDAMVNLRHGLAMAEREGCITERTRGLLVAEAKAMFYPDRAWPAIFARARALTVPEEEVARLRDFVRRVRPDRKRDDALALLSRLREEGAAEVGPHVTSFVFEPTTFWAKLVRVASPSPSSAAGDGSVPGKALLAHVRVAPDGEEALRGAVLLELLDAEARRRGVHVGPIEAHQALDRLRRRHRLVSAEATRAWLRENAISAEDLRAIARLEAVLDALVEARRGDPEGAGGALALELKLRGRYGEARAQIEEKRRAASGDAPPIPLPEVVDWYQREVRLVGDSLEAHARELHFERVEDLIEVMVDQYRAATRPRLP